MATVKKLWLTNNEETRVAPSTTIDQIYLDDGTKFETEYNSAVFLSEEGSTEVDWAAIPLTHNDLINGLTSTMTTRALTANQGKVLNDKIAATNSAVSTNASNITTNAANISTLSSSKVDVSTYNTKMAALDTMDSTIKSELDTAISAVATDTELLDIRVKADGTTSTTAGNAVREQVSELKDDIANAVNDPVSVNVTWTEGIYIDSKDGVAKEYTGWHASDFIEIPDSLRNSKGIYFITSPSTGYTLTYNAFYDEGQNFISSFAASGTPTVPMLAKYFRVSFSSAVSCRVEYLFNLAGMVSDIEDSLKMTANLSSLETLVPCRILNGDTFTVYTDGGENFTVEKLYLYDSNRKYIDYYSLSPFDSNIRRNLVMDVASDVYYIALYGGTVQNIVVEVVNYSVGDKLQELLDDADILNLNPGIKPKLIQMNRRYNDDAGGKYTSLPEIFTLLHFSDIHGDETNLARIQEFKDAYAVYLDDTICSGDMTENNCSTTAMDFWSACDGNILMVIGNHDVWNDSSGSTLISMSDAYTAYMSPYIGNWGVTYEDGKTYYYKDYKDKGIRLIVLDCMLTGTNATNQNTWLATALSGALSSGYSVVIAEHYMSPDPQKIICSFTSYIKSVDNTDLSSTYLASVQSFINSGGDFVCWLCGHEHSDFVTYSKDYPDQIFLTVACATANSYWTDADRVVGDKSQDAFNIFSVDTYSNVIKLTRVGCDHDQYLRNIDTLAINYKTKEVISGDGFTFPTLDEAEDYLGVS